MFGLNWPELMIISVVALIVIGPEDLPKMFRELGRFTAKLRQMSREFSRAMEQAAKETGVSDMAKDLRNVTSAKSLGLDAVKEAANKFEKWDPLKNAAKPAMPSTSPAKPLTPPPMPATPPATPPQVSSLTSVAERDAAALAEDMPEIEDELADDLADIADLEALDGVEPTIHGPATQALYDKAALRSKVMAEQTEKLKAIEAGTYRPETLAPEAPLPKAPTTKAPTSKTATTKTATAKPPKALTAETKAVAAGAKPVTDPTDKPKRNRIKADPAPKAAKIDPAPKAAKVDPAPKTPKKTRKTPGEETA